MAEPKATATKKEPFPSAPPPVTAPAPAPLPTLTAEQRKKLGDTFLAAQGKAEKAEAAYDAARAEKSDAVKALVDATGHKGPFSIGGKNWLAKQSKSTGSFSMTEQATAKDSFG
jgi:hypothetical protein